MPTAKVTSKGNREIATLQQSLSRLETRLKNQDDDQKTIASRLEVIHKSFMDQLQAKDGTVRLIKEMSDSVQKQNDALQKQMGLRFNFVTGMTGFIALAFALNFTYNLYQVKDVMNAKEFLEDGSRIIAENATTFSDVLANLARADTLVTQGHREFLRASYLDARDLATEAINLLGPAYEKTGLSLSDLKDQTYDPTTCQSANQGMRVHRVAVPRFRNAAVEKSFEGTGPRTLQPAIRGALITAYDLRARANFFARPRGNIRDDGRFLIALNDAGWEGYHWLGLAANDYTEAVVCFKKSVNQKHLANRDHINLAELLFIDGKYLEAKSHADAYLKPLNYSFVSATEAIAQFYLAVSSYLAPGGASHGTITTDGFRTRFGELVDVKLEGTFSTGDLEKYLSGPKFKNLNADQRAEVKATAECLIKRSCGN